MVTLELPPPLEHKLREKAEGHGLTLEAYLVRVVEREVEPAPPRAPLRGRLAGAASDLSLEEFQQARREGWSDFSSESR